MNRYLDLFLTFARVGACTFGGGYAMLPILQREIVEKKKWATEEELADYYAIGQCTPGVIAVNTATFVGRTQGGVAGGVLATLGVVFPSVVIVLLIAAFLQNFAEVPAVIHAFNGVRACVCALILSSVIKLGKKALTDLPAKLIFLVVLLLAAQRSFFDWGGAVGFLTSPPVLVVAAGLVGICVRAVRGGLKA